MFIELKRIQHQVHKENPTSAFQNSQQRWNRGVGSALMRERFCGLDFNKDEGGRNQR